MKQILVFCAMVLVIASGAHAALISDSDVSSGTLPQTANTVDTLAVDQFDPLLGTLTKVTISLDNIFDWTNKGENLDGPGSISQSLDMDLLISLGATGLLPDSLAFNQTWPVGTYDGVIDFGGTSGFTAPGQSNLETFTIDLTGSDMLPFLGAGTVGFTVFGSSQSRASDTTGNVVNWISSQYTANALVTYEYTPVPIPAAVWLLGSGVIGLAGLRRRIKK